MESGLNIIVCVKAVLKDPPDGPVLRSSETCELNPYDIPALRLALDLKGSHGGAVSVLSMAPTTCEFVLRECLAMGAEQACLVCDPAFGGADTLATSRVLARAVKKWAHFDLLVFGGRAADSDTGQVPPQVAQRLGLPLVTGVFAVAKTGGALVVDRRADGLVERYEMDFPCALSVHSSYGGDSYLGLETIEEAYEGRKITSWQGQDLTMDPEEVGERGSRTRVISYSRIERERKCLFLEGTLDEQAEKLISLLGEWGFEW